MGETEVGWIDRSGYLANMRTASQWEDRNNKLVQYIYEKTIEKKTWTHELLGKSSRRFNYEQGENKVYVSLSRPSRFGDRRIESSRGLSVLKSYVSSGVASGFGVCLKMSETTSEPYRSAS